MRMCTQVKRAYSIKMLNVTLSTPGGQVKELRLNLGNSLDSGATVFTTKLKICDGIMMYLFRYENHYSTLNTDK